MYVYHEVGKEEHGTTEKIEHIDIDVASNFDKGGRGNRMHMTTETPFAP